MDAVHGTGNRPFIAEVMSPTEFQESWKDATKNERQADDEQTSLREALMQKLGVSEDVFKRLEDECRPSALLCGEESMDVEKLPDYDGLETLRLQKEDIEKRKADKAYRLKTSEHFHKVCFLSKVNCTKRGDPWNAEEDDRGPSKENCTKRGDPCNAQEDDDRVPSNEVVLIVQVFKPIKMPVELKKVRMGAQNFPFKIQAELALLGCQSLRTLREKISCVSDAVLVGDFSDDPDRTSGQKACDLYKSGFFYIGNTFYNDMSDPSCRDYSEVIIEWAKDPKREIGPFNVVDMADTKLSDLNLRLGYPYVFVHQGYCEHLVVFSDMRMHHPHDSQCLADYPVSLKACTHGKSVFCMMCHQKIATWVTYENERVTSDPYFFCDHCFRSYNYTADNQKIGNFRAGQFLDWNMVL